MRNSAKLSDQKWQQKDKDRDVRFNSLREIRGQVADIVEQCLSALSYPLPASIIRVLFQDAASLVLS